MRQDKIRTNPRGISIITGIGPGTTCDGEVFVRYFAEHRSNGDYSFEKDPKAICLYAIAEGQARFTYQDRSWDLVPGDVFIIRPRQRLRYAEQPGTATHYYFFNLKGDRAEERLQTAQMTDETPMKSCPQILPILERAHLSISENRTTPYFPITLAWQLLDTLTFADGRTSREQGSRAEVCREMIDSDYMNDLTVSSIARQLGIDRTTLFRQFTKRYNCSPQQYLQHTRLRHARERLLQSSGSIKEIALSCGFRDPDYFSRAFSAEHGKPPARWREERQR